jgi:hypothetical protein
MSLLKYFQRPVRSLGEVVCWSWAAPMLAKVDKCFILSMRACPDTNLVSALRGYMTKYDCSSADINPIGSIDKEGLKGFLGWAQVHFDLPCLEDFLNATPTAELEPVTEDYTQSDEADMGMTYAELTAFGIYSMEIQGV